MMNAIQLSERDLHAGVVEYLKLVLVSDAVMHHSPNEGRRGWKAQRDIKTHGTKAGWPDLEILHRGNTYFVELKSAKGRLTTRQKQCHEQLRQAGFCVETCRSLNEVIICCQKWGLIDAA